jgi:hypothetical protein
LVLYKVLEKTFVVKIFLLFRSIVVFTFVRLSNNIKILNKK